MMGRRRTLCLGKGHSPELIIRKLQEAKATAYLLQMRSLLVLRAMGMRPLPRRGGSSPCS
jgi:hypothetical protein